MDSPISQSSSRPDVDWEPDQLLIDPWWLYNDPAAPSLTLGPPKDPAQQNRAQICKVGALWGLGRGGGDCEVGEGFINKNVFIVNKKGKGAV